MRFYLDTNILIFLLDSRKGEISATVAKQVFDYGNLLYTSMVCVHEFVHLFQIGKQPSAASKWKSELPHVGRWLENLGIEVKPVTMENIEMLASLPLVKDHRDPNDRLIIAQAISDRIPLVSSDRKFHLYERFGLKYVYNKR